MGQVTTDRTGHAQDGALQGSHVKSGHGGLLAHTRLARPLPPVGADDFVCD